MTRAWRALRRFWESDRGLSVFLGLLVVFLFVLPPLVEPEGHGRSLIVDLGLSVLLLAGVAAASPHRAVKALLFALVMGALVVRWGPFSAPATAAAALVTVVALTFVVLAQAFRAGPVNVHRIQGAVAAYLLLGLAWALAYEALALVADGAFSSGGPVEAERGRFIYFSFVTLTTVGYGDVTPVHPVARSLAVAEALAGQLYPAILLARLVSLATTPGPQVRVRGRRRRRQGPGGARSAGTMAASPLRPRAPRPRPLLPSGGSFARPGHGTPQGLGS